MVVVLSQRLAHYVPLAKFGLHLVFANIVLLEKSLTLMYVLSTTTLKKKNSLPCVPFTMTTTLIILLTPDVWVFQTLRNSVTLAKCPTNLTDIMWN